MTSTLITDIVRPKSDIMFKKLFGEDGSEEFTKDLLSGVLDLPDDAFDEISYENPNLTPNSQGKKAGIVDVHLKLRNQESVIIEMQNYGHAAYRDRVLFYAAKAYVDQLVKGDEYDDIKRTIGVSFLAFDLFIDSYENYYDYFFMMSPKSGRIFTSNFELHVLEMGKIPFGVVKERIIMWLKFLDVKTKEELYMAAGSDPILKRAADKVVAFSADDAVRRIAEAEEKALRDWKQINKETGAKHYVKGHAEGHAEGRTEEKANIAKTLLGMDAETAYIAEATGLSIEEINKLR